LGLKKSEDWNKAAILNHIWNIFAKSGSLRVAWVRMNLIKGKCFWLIKIHATWSRRKILKLKEITKKISEKLPMPFLMIRVLVNIQSKLPFISIGGRDTPMIELSTE
jgi:hypothetical protein